MTVKQMKMTLQTGYEGTADVAEDPPYIEKTLHNLCS